MDNSSGTQILDFRSIQAGIDHWAATYGPSVQGDMDMSQFVLDLASAYNSRDPAWSTNITGTIESVQHAEVLWSPPVRKRASSYLLSAWQRSVNRRLLQRSMLNERGYRTRNGSKFSDTTVDRLIRDTTAKGTYRQNYTRTSDKTKAWEFKPESEWVLTPVEPIISEELWATCNQILEDQHNSRKPVTRANVHLFTGFAHCECGSKMYVWAESPKYVCPKCRNKIPMADLEFCYRDQLSQFLKSPDQIAAHLEAANDALREKEALVAAHEAELKKIEIEDERLYQLYLSDKLSPDDFGRRHKPLSERRSQLEDELPRLQATVDVMRISSMAERAALSEATDFAAGWDQFKPEEKRRLVELITDNIVVGKEEVAINLLYLPSVAETGGKATQSQGFMAATSWKRAG
jgi:site-specific DNA recombinase